MTKIILSIIAFFLINLSSYGQNDQNAIKILDKFSSNALGAPSVSMKFDLVTVDQKENTNDTISGSVILSKDKYQLTLPNNIVWFNGETSWSYLQAEKEVTITKPGKKDNSFQSRPSAIFSLYKKGYKTRLIGENNDSYIIDLYPEDIKSDLLRIRLSISKPLMGINTMEYKQKDGIIRTLYVSDYNLKKKPEADAFTFRPEKYKGAEVIDMR